MFINLKPFLKQTVLNFAMAAALTGPLSSCRNLNPPPNQTQGVRSPNGHYELTVPMRAHTDAGYRVWQVTIHETDYGSIIYKDTLSEFVGNLNVYWIWDQDNRVWLYNSDDGHVYFWQEHLNGGWDKAKWGYGRINESGQEITPPEALYPEYVE